MILCSITLLFIGNTSSVSPFQILVTETATKAVAAITVLSFELYKRLAVGSSGDLYATLTPLTSDEVVFGLHLLKQHRGTLHQSLVAKSRSSGKEQRADRVYYNKVTTCRRQTFTAGA